MLLSQSKKLEIYLKRPVEMFYFDGEDNLYSRIYGLRGVIVGDCIPAGSTPIGKDVKVDSVYGIFDSFSDKQWLACDERLGINTDNILMLRLCQAGEEVDA
jgi:hypothetical protein